MGPSLFRCRGARAAGDLGPSQRRRGALPRRLAPARRRTLPQAATSQHRAPLAQVQHQTGRGQPPPTGARKLAARRVR